MEETVESKFILATGRRKEASARVKLTPGGSGRIVINGRELDKYFTVLTQQMQVKKPLLVAKRMDTIDVRANVQGGGITGQAGAISLGIARGLLQMEADLRSTFRKEDLLTRDPRAKERKKYGRKGARRRFQWTKR